MSEIERAANPTTEEAIKYLERMLFTQDFSPSTLRAKAVNTMAIEALREKAERERGCEYTLYNPADEGYDDGLFYQCTCGENYIDPAQAKEWDFCPHCGNSIRSKDTKMCIDCENAEYEGEAGHWCAKHICWVDDTTCFDGCKDFHARKLDGGGQDEPKGH